VENEGNKWTLKALRRYLVEKEGQSVMEETFGKIRWFGVGGIGLLLLLLPIHLSS